MLPDNWNENEDLISIDYSFNSKGYELKALKSDDLLIVNLTVSSEIQILYS